MRKQGLPMKTQKKVNAPDIKCFTVFVYSSLSNYPASGQRRPWSDWSGTHNRQISPKTVWSRLRKIGLRARRPYVGLPLTQARRLRRMAWLTAHVPRLFPMRQWRRVLFTDESRFTLYRADGRRRVYRRRGERFADACVVERDRFGGGSVMVWGGIAHGIKSQLIIVAGNMTAVRYRDEILRPVAVPLVQQRNLILQQDNARPHVARVCQDFLANNNIAPLAWPPYSPDLTPIEHMWDELDRRVRKRRNPPATLAQLRNALIDEWNNIPMRTVNALVNSIQRRIRAATAARGGHTRYWFSVWFWFQDLGGSYQWTSITRDLLITNQWNLELLFHTCTRFVIIVKYLTNFFKLEWNLGIKFTLRFFFLSVYICFP